MLSHAASLHSSPLPTRFPRFLFCSQCRRRMGRMATVRLCDRCKTARVACVGKETLLDICRSLWRVTNKLVMDCATTDLLFGIQAVSIRHRFRILLTISRNVQARPALSRRATHPARALLPSKPFLLAQSTPEIQSILPKKTPLSFNNLQAIRHFRAFSSTTCLEQMSINTQLPSLAAG